MACIEGIERDLEHIERNGAFPAVISFPGPGSEDSAFPYLHIVVHIERNRYQYGETIIPCSHICNNETFERKLHVDAPKNYTTARSCSYWFASVRVMFGPPWQARKDLYLKGSRGNSRGKTASPVYQDQLDERPLKA